MPSHIDPNDEHGQEIINQPMEWDSFTHYLGYDLTQRTDIERLIKNFIFIDQLRLKSEKKVIRRNAITVTVATAAVTAFITVSFTWLFNSGMAAHWFIARIFSAS